MSTDGFMAGWCRLADERELANRVQANLPAAAILAIRLVDENADELTEDGLVEFTLRLASKLAKGASSETVK